MPWGKVSIKYPTTGYTQNYKRQDVVTHIQCQNMVADAVADSIKRIGVPGAIVIRDNIGQNMAGDPGVQYRNI